MQQGARAIFSGAARLSFHSRTEAICVVYAKKKTLKVLDKSGPQCSNTPFQHRH